MRNAIKVVDNIEDSIEYIDTLHRDSKGWITKAEINKAKEKDLKIQMNGFLGLFL